MQVQLRFFATFREAVGQKHLSREYGSNPTAGDILHELATEYPGLEFFEANGELREHLSIMRNGRDIAFLDGVETELTDGDTLSIFPPVAGGSETTVVRSFRGISRRAVLRYLDRIGGNPQDEETVVGANWRANISTDDVAIGPTLRLTEVTVRFEGCEDVLESVVEAFAQKAVRAGG